MRIKKNIFRLVSLPLLLMIKCYQLLISPFLGQNCRFYPTCSHYAHQALITHGPITGVWLSLKRISKCHPLHEGGIDLVPSKPVKYKKFFPSKMEQPKYCLSKERANNFHRINDN